MASFAALRTSRHGKETKSYVKSHESDAVVSHVSSISPPKQEDHDENGLFNYIPKSLEIRSSDEAGRGIWTKGISNTGTTLLSCKPKLAVLSNTYLDTHCSACFGPAPPAGLQRCTQCRTVWYCDAGCQNRDWSFHKLECAALKRWAAAAPSSEVSIPNDAIRCLGRLIWKRKKAGATSEWAREINAMQSHRSTMQPSTTEFHAHLALAIVQYLGLSSPTDLAEFDINSAADLVDVISRFTTNSFTLTSPSLTPLGVCVSPAIALINHSCDPNAVVVFPRSSESTAQEPLMQVIAIKPIAADEEILTSYIDTTLPKSQRQQSLLETYNFTCKCTLCKNEGLSDNVDPRIAMWCPKACGGTSPLPVTDTDIVRCSKCKAVVTSTDAVIDAVRVGQEGLDKATALQFRDPEKSKQLTNNLIPILLSTGLTPSTHPLLGLSRLQQSLLISSLPSITSLTSSQEERKAAQDLLDEAIRSASRSVSGLTAVLHEGHPVRGIALTELGKLLAVDEPSPKEAQQPADAHPHFFSKAAPFPPSGPPRLKLAYTTLMRAREELLIGFGKANDGGEVGRDVREALVAIEKELGVWKQGVQTAIQDQPKPEKR
ncbi:MUB1/samB family protein [Pleurotus pulmonarius]